jgi:hypothetical protein
MGEKIGEGVVLTVGDDVWGCCFQGLCAYFQIWKVRLCQMKNSIKIWKKKKIALKYGKKRGGWCSLLVMMFGVAVFRVQCIFPNMESEAVLNEK